MDLDCRDGASVYALRLSAMRCRPFKLWLMSSFASALKRGEALNSPLHGGKQGGVASRTCLSACQTSREMCECDKRAGATRPRPLSTMSEAERSRDADIFRKLTEEAKAVQHSVRL